MASLKGSANGNGTSTGNLMGDGFFADILTQFEKDIENIDVDLDEVGEDGGGGGGGGGGDDDDDLDAVAGDFAIPDIDFGDLDSVNPADGYGSFGGGKDSKQGEYELAMASMGGGGSSSAPGGRARSPTPVRDPIRTCRRRPSSTSGWRCGTCTSCATRSCRSGTRARMTSPRSRRRRCGRCK